MKKIVKIERIREYANHELSEQEQQVLEKQMLTDKDLLEEVNATIVLKAQLDRKQKQLWEEYEQDYVANPEKWKEEFPPKAESTPKRVLFQLPPIKVITRIAASFMLFLAAYFLLSPPMSTQTLATKYWEEATASDQFNFHTQTRKSPNPVLSQEEKRKLQLEQAYEFFGEKEYQQTLLFLEKIPQESHYYAKALLLKGVSLFELKQNQEAIQNLQTILQNRSFSGNDDARKFLALIYLQTNQLEEAKQILEEIIEAKDSFAEKAKDLLERLK